MKYLKILSLFLIVAVQSCISADEDPVSVPPMTGATSKPAVGGATEPNQIWIDLSDIDPITKEPKQTINKRTDWDLGFYNGDEFRVIINGAIGMAVGKIPNATNFSSVGPADVSSLMGVVQIGTFTETNLEYVDNPNGNFLTQTSGIAEIKANDAENPIYLVNMGRVIPTAASIAPGSVSLTGDARGWKKIQIIRATNGYKIKHADLNGDNYHEYVITKNPDYNFKFYSLQKAAPVEIQPKKDNWDIVFTTFTNEVFLGPGQSAGSYFYADFIVTNMESGVGTYQVDVPTGQTLDQVYGAFKLSNIQQSKFIFNDHRAIGDKWRTTTGANGAQTYNNRFFILKDAEGFYYKLRFNAMTNDKGERGYPNFEFEPL